VIYGVQIATAYAHKSNRAPGNSRYLQDCPLNSSGGFWFYWKGKVEAMEG
jgi:hypothetical protein